MSKISISTGSIQLALAIFAGLCSLVGGVVWLSAKPSMAQVATAIKDSKSDVSQSIATVKKESRRARSRIRGNCIRRRRELKMEMVRRYNTLQRDINDIKKDVRALLFMYRRRYKNRTRRRKRE